VRTGKLREDLYYRLYVFTIGLPPLRDRRDDLALLIHTFVEEFNQRDQRSVKAVDPEAMRRMEAFIWPGNVRELRNVIERAVILAKGDLIEVRHLPPLAADRRVGPASPSSVDITLTPGMTVDDAEQKLILATLDAAGGNKTRAAEMLGISLKTLHNKINRMKQGA
jgi:DNA-binding NtrC family response regulator